MDNALSLRCSITVLRLTAFNFQFLAVLGRNEYHSSAPKELLPG